MDRKRAAGLRQRARAVTGPLLTARVVCQACGEASEAEYRVPPETFPCAYCERGRAIRETDDPYPPPMPAREM